MVGFTTAVLIGILVLVVPYKIARRRRPEPAPLTWGQAMMAAMYTYFVLFWWYGVIPHQWLTMANSEWSWRPDRIFVGPGDIFRPNRFLPFVISYQTLRDLVLVLIYGVALTLHVWHWAQWQNRAKPKAEVVPTTTYGRPLARKS